MPAEIASEAMLADTMFTGLTNQLGLYTSHTLAPGKYLAFATSQTFDGYSGKHR
jgi:hypothetical protein